MEEQARPGWQGQWDRRYAEVCAAAHLTDAQATDYRLYLAGLSPDEIATQRHGLAPVRASDGNWAARKLFWRRRHRQLRDVALNVSQAEAAILASNRRDCRRMSREFVKDLLRCHRNRLTDWSHQPIATEPMACEDDRPPASRPLTAADLPQQTQSSATEYWVRDLAASREMRELTTSGVSRP